MSLFNSLIGYGTGKPCFTCTTGTMYELLILDEWLMYEMSDQDKQFISELMEVRHDTCSTIFCSQYPTEDWYDKLHKSTLTEALLDRIVHNRIDIDMGTDNFRIK